MKNGKIEVDLYRKESDRNQYLLPSSIHPKTVTKNIPFSLSLRIVRTCTNIQERDERLNELKNMLTSREYPDKLIDSAIERARAIPRRVALRKVDNTKILKKPVFAVRFDPRLPSISSIQAKHWRAMVTHNQYLASCFPEPPLTAFKRPRNIKEFLIRAKVPPPPDRRDKREIKGMKKCGKQCSACPYIQEGRNIRIDKINIWKKNKKFKLQQLQCYIYARMQKRYL